MTPSTPVDQEKYQAVRAKIIEAYPELMELTFGCRYIGVDYDSDGDPYPVQGIVLLETPHPQTVGEIIGHPIRLVHCLQALRKKSTEELGWEWNQNGGIGWTEAVEKILLLWNLATDDLATASAECVSFLYDVLYGPD